MLVWQWWNSGVGNGDGDRSGNDGGGTGIGIFNLVSCDHRGSDGGGCGDGGSGGVVVLGSQQSWKWHGVSTSGGRVPAVAG